MRHPGDAFGRGCLLVSLTALWALLAMRLYVVWRDGLWLVWPAGDFLPDPLVRRVFALENEGLRQTFVWLLGQDALYWVAAVCLLVWILSTLATPPSDGEDDEFSR